MGCEVFLVHWPDMPRSTTDVFIGTVGFPPLVPRPPPPLLTSPVLAAGKVSGTSDASTTGLGVGTRAAVLGGDAFIQLTPNDVRLDFPYDYRKQFATYNPERLI